VPAYILSLDQGTSSSRALVFDETGSVRASAACEFPQIFPRPGWVEHDPEAIWTSQLDAARQALALAGIDARQVAAIGIANQRETTILWDRETGRPISNAIVWQCRRTASLCEALTAAGAAPEIQRRSGLVVDAYFSGTKIRWLLDSIPGAREAAEAGRLAFGTVDSWLIWRLTGGRQHLTDLTNASRTMLFSLETLSWDDELLQLLHVPRALLPEPRLSSGAFGETDSAIFGARIPIRGVAGDQQAALFGQACFAAGMAKNTYGTGCFLLLNVGPRPRASEGGLLTTIGIATSAAVRFALEGSVFAAGAAVQWLRDGLGLIDSAAASEVLAAQVESSDGVYLVPAFAGLGAPYWDMHARGAILGLTRGSTAAHIARATLEAIALQSRDLVEAMEAEAGVRLVELRVDGGATANNLLMQIQADVLGRAVLRPAIDETTALGAAYLAGLSAGIWSSEAELSALWRPGRRYEPASTPHARERHYRGWSRAVARSRAWAEDDQ
jgi:glycerol kinase